MRVHHLSSSLKTVLFLGAWTIPHTLAGPSINVALRASFNSAPYLIELLETAAEENSTAYFPILDRIAQGYFATGSTEQELYTRFVNLLQDDGHITDLETLSSFQLALSVRSAAPRIEAHYQFYNTTVEPLLLGDQSRCSPWILFGGKQHCSPQLEWDYDALDFETVPDLPFDRILGDKADAPASVLYTDITSPSFALFHETLTELTKEGKITYRIRHKLSPQGSKKPLVVNGYGVELQLKRTDYIVIDDRQAAEAEKSSPQMPQDNELHDEEVADLKPLSSSEVAGLAVNAASFVLKSDHPLDTLERLVSDFPKYSSAVASHNASEDFLIEHEENRKQFLPAGYNIIWVNGVQLPARDVNPFTLLEHLRRERALVNGVRSQGLSGPEAIGLLSHPTITENQGQDEPQRYDFRDETEGGNVIIWLNDMEKDKRYEGWPSDLTALLARTYPGQLPSIRRDIHNIILPVDFTSRDDVFSIIETVQGMVKRKVPVRWGIVPRTNSPGALDQAKVVYHLLETYGLSAVIKYLDTARENKKLSRVDTTIFEAAINNANLRTEQKTLSLPDVLTSEAGEVRIKNAKDYLTRLASSEHDGPLFVNGVPIAKNEEWLQLMSQRVGLDLRQIQRGVFENVFQEDAWVPQFFLFQAALKRNPLIIPENEKNITLVNVADFEEKHGKVFEQMPKVKATEAPAEIPLHLTLVADFDSKSGLTLLRSASQYRKEHENLELVLIHNPQISAKKSSTSERLFQRWTQNEQNIAIDDLLELLVDESTISITDGARHYWKEAQKIYDAFGLKPGQHGLLLNGRFVGPFPEASILSQEDVETLVSYETTKRVEPLSNALKSLTLIEKISVPFAFAKLQSLVSLSGISDVPEGIFESASTLRTALFKKWNETHTAISKGNEETAIIQITASIDPATELAQKWVPILKTLSEMDGVYLKLFLNPSQRIQELPVKRFYRYLVRSAPSFSDDGSVEDLEAHFAGIPKEALLNLGMDVPPSWLVAPVESIHDLDNIKLSSLKSGADIDAIYGLENILIEGHSRDTTNGGQPPRGAELVLSTEKNPHLTDTIIMANLGYFQFKANPGFFRIELKKGRSQEIFKIDSAGPKGYAPVAGDETSEIGLISFQGTTLFPRLSRRAGFEDADVLAVEESAASDIFEKGAQKVNQFLGKVGLGGIDAEKVLRTGAQLLSKTGLIADDSTSNAAVQADINIFSVASGHLYERMLNIMMVSVTRHTNHTVKFWFIEQFLSPSFKSFLPHMAAQYRFQYEMVTYKWPHWLRGQSEKQREIWGYKILFLDVLFPLDLDKVIFVDADQIVRTDMIELVQHDLEGAPYGFTPMCDSRTEMEGFRFWKQGYWANFLRGLPYHISALYVVDLKRFRQIAAGDRLRQQYHSLSADPASLSNLDQDLPNNMQFNLPIHSLPQNWLWCETWCSDESLKDAKTIDLCNNPQTKEPKLDRARRQVPEWTEYDDEIAALAKRISGHDTGSLKERSRVKDEL